LLKYDDDEDEGSAEERTLGSGVVLRLRGVAEGLEPGFALPLLLTFVGAMVDERLGSGGMVLLVQSTVVAKASPMTLHVG
jgi:hypothetical protein